MLRGEHVTLRPLLETDAGPLAALFAHPEVARWWLNWDEARVRAELLDSREAAVLAIEVEERLAGVIMFTEEDDPDYRFAQVDVTVAGEHVGRGLGTDALRTLLRYLIRERGHHHVLIDPAADNARAIRAYEKVGFKPVGILRQYERRPDGWADALLMDLVADEFEELEARRDASG
ncbi:MAG: GNAT family N-acetyltransferase [Coriobacteriia bacterium]|nr:GNAT family N-acetyltransferase [Coriobacteriia bacterium]